MPHFYDTLEPNLSKWALEQSIFFTASAPTYGEHINLSPKGLPSTTFAVFDESHCAYLDLTGSGAETISHIYENGRVTVMFCSFSEKPRILRLYCTGRVVELGDPTFDEEIKRTGLENIPGTRAVVLLDIWKVQTSCGYAVPTIEDSPTTNTNSHTHSTSNGTTIGPAVSTSGELIQPPCKCFQDRRTLEQWLVNKISKDALDEYKTKLNSRSLDGLPGMRSARRMKGEWIWAGDVGHWALNRLGHPMAVVLGVVLGFLFAMLIFSPGMSWGAMGRVLEVRVEGVIAVVALIVRRNLVLAKRGSRTVRRMIVGRSKF